MTGPLGRGGWECFLTSRGGGTRIAKLPTTAYSFTRKVDDTSQITTSLVPDETCSQLLADAVPWQYELSLERDGFSEWAGPLLDVEHSYAGVQLMARDLFYWFDRRRLEQAFDITADMSRIFEFIVEQALARDTSPNILVRPTPTGVVGRRTNDRSGITRSGDVLREIARTAVDFTMVGRTIYVGGQTLDAGTGRVVLIQNAFADDAKITSLGDLTISEATVYGENADLVATVGGVGSVTGLVQTVEQESNIEDEVSLLNAAQGRLDIGQDRFYQVTGTLTPEADVSFSDLIPGIEIDCELELQGRQVLDPLRLAEVTANISKAGEKIGVTLQPLGLDES